MKSLYEYLKSLNTLPMHMPGHKRNTELFPQLAGAELDITEIDGFDNLHNSQGILKASMEKCAKLRGADRAFYLVNGATCGILASVHALVRRGDKVICARNCHKSVYNALELVGAEVRFVLPKISEELGCYGEISVTDIKAAIAETHGVKLVIITSPTYEGIVSDVEGICCAAKDIPVLVDAAHGAHLGIGWLKSAIECGADIVVESLHKTMPSLTQTAVCYTSDKYADKISKSLAVFETSSPSYILMSAIDGCVRLIADRGEELFGSWQKNLDLFYEGARTLKILKIYCGQGAFAYDRSKIVIYGARGADITSALRKRGIEPEMTSLYYTVCMTGVGDTEESVTHLLKALIEADKEISACEGSMIYPPLPQKRFLPDGVRDKPHTFTELKDSVGKISAEYLFAYPPGIPLVIPGEEISAEIATLICSYEAAGVEILGSSGKILVC